MSALATSALSRKVERLGTPAIFPRSCHLARSNWTNHLRDGTAHQQCSLKMEDDPDGVTAYGLSVKQEKHHERKNGSLCSPACVGVSARDNKRTKKHGPHWFNWANSLAEVEELIGEHS